MKTSVYYKDGTEVLCEPIDAMELLAQKDYTVEPPKPAKPRGRKVAPKADAK